MRFVLKFLAVAAGLAALGAAGWYGFERYQSRFVRTDADLVKLLPPGDLTTFYVNLAALRQGGLAYLFTGVKPATEQDYADFVSSTGFDYARDIDSLAGGADDRGQLFFLMRGKFDWEKLRQYAMNHRGTCTEEGCRAPGTKPKRWVQFLRIQGDTLALSIGENAFGADLLRPPGRRNDSPPGDPVWVNVAHGLIKDPTVLPKPLQIFAISLRAANSVMLSAGQAEHKNEAFTVQMEAEFPDSASADTTCKQMQIQTRMLRLALAKDNHEPNPADLTGLITAGAFQAGNNRVFGSWPVRKELLSFLGQ